MAQETQNQHTVKELSDELAESLLKLPEVQEEIRMLNEIKANYRDELMARVRNARPNNKIPRVVDIKEKYQKLIERQ